MIRKFLQTGVLFACGLMSCEVSQLSIQEDMVISGLVSPEERNHFLFLSSLQTTGAQLPVDDAKVWVSVNDAPPVMLDYDVQNEAYLIPVLGGKVGDRLSLEVHANQQQLSSSCFMPFPPVGLQGDQDTLIRGREDKLVLSWANPANEWEVMAAMPLDSIQHSFPYDTLPALMRRYPQKVSQYSLAANEFEYDGRYLVIVSHISNGYANFLKSTFDKVAYLSEGNIPKAKGYWGAMASDTVLVVLKTKNPEQRIDVVE